MDAFPDELVLRVLSLVSDAHTMVDSVPLVCKRWRRLLNEPEAWRSASLVVHSGRTKGAHDAELELTRSRMVEVLQRAPYLDSLEVVAVASGSPASHNRLESTLRACLQRRTPPVRRFSATLTSLDERDHISSFSEVFDSWQCILGVVSLLTKLEHLRIHVSANLAAVSSGTPFFCPSYMGQLQTGLPHLRVLEVAGQVPDELLMDLLAGSLSSLHVLDLTLSRPLVPAMSSVLLPHCEALRSITLRMREPLLDPTQPTPPLAKQPELWLPDLTDCERLQELAVLVNVRRDTTSNVAVRVETLLRQCEALPPSVRQLAVRYRARVYTDELSPGTQNLAEECERSRMLLERLRPDIKVAVTVLAPERRFANALFGGEDEPAINEYSAIGVTSQPNAFEAERSEVLQLVRQYGLRRLSGVYCNGSSEAVMTWCLDMLRSAAPLIRELQLWNPTALHVAAIKAMPQLRRLELRTCPNALGAYIGRLPQQSDVDSPTSSLVWLKVLGMGFMSRDMLLALLRLAGPTLQSLWMDTSDVAPGTAQASWLPASLVRFRDLPALLGECRLPALRRLILMSRPCSGAAGKTRWHAPLARIGLDLGTSCWAQRGAFRKRLPNVAVLCQGCDDVAWEDF